ncbi:MAG: Lrp/AsnC ligand binding domain-containing protein [Coprothermobacterota bacterium]|jgi:DNA-binding Lrp family transcriptional regulator|nr:Lrp/AsnC ligand binding domain-containing protein [Coprothermobacterota bacterium]
MKAYVLIDAEVGSIPHVQKELMSVPEVKIADVVTGPYDVIAVIETDDPSVMSNLVTSKIHQIEGVVATMTCMVM